MQPTIPVECELITGSGNRADTYRIQFAVPPLGEHITAHFPHARGAAAFKRLNKIIDKATTGAPVEELEKLLLAFEKPARAANRGKMTTEQLAEYRRANGWENPAAIEAPAPITPANITPQPSRDGRYIIDPARRTIEPIADIPANIAAIMPKFDCTSNHVVPVPTFDIAPGYETAAEIEQTAAELVAAEATKLFQQYWSGSVF